MKTSLIVLFQAINDAKLQLIAERSKPHTPAELDKIRKAITILDQLASDILILDLTTQAEQLEGEVKALEDLTERINNTSDNLAHIAKVLDKITAKVKAVLEVASVLTEVGLLAA